ncbi:S-protein-like protein 2-like [Senna tora]|uniref:S-protein homolog n=1 Tax=Senna tora TaxID=362788 RepID=A0A834XFS7_9FABA|nr:S-protein-like protein 2-like [Senna tora]
MSQSFRITTLLPTTLTVLLLLASESSNVVVHAKTHVRVYNGLDHGNILTVHCKSSDDDIGTLVVRPGGFFEFSFKVDFFFTTLFHCTFQWPGVTHRFDIYDAVREDCLECYWRITESQPLDGRTSFTWAIENSVIPSQSSISLAMTLSRVFERITSWQLACGFQPEARVLC